NHCASYMCLFCFFFSSRRRHTRSKRDWSSDVCSSDLSGIQMIPPVCVSRGRWCEKLLELNAAGPDAVSSIGADGRATRCGITLRSEERRVGKECRSGGGPGDGKGEKDDGTTRGRERRR